MDAKALPAFSILNSFMERLHASPRQAEAGQVRAILRAPRFRHIPQGPAEAGLLRELIARRWGGAQSLLDLTGGTRWRLRGGGENITGACRFPLCLGAEPEWPSLVHPQRDS